MNVCERGLTQLVEVVIRLIVSCVVCFSLTFSLFASIGRVEDILPVRDSNIPWTLKIFSATDSVLVTVSVELSVNRKSFSPVRYVVAGIVNSPPTTPFLSADNAPENAGIVDPTVVILPFAFAFPIPWNTSPARNPPVCVTWIEAKEVVSPFA